MQDLDERKRKILKAIIQTYLKLVSRSARGPFPNTQI